MRDIKKSPKEEFDDSTLEPTWAHTWQWNESFCKVEKQTHFEARLFGQVSWGFMNLASSVGQSCMAGGRIWNGNNREGGLHSHLAAKAANRFRVESVIVCVCFVEVILPRQKLKSAATSGGSIVSWCHLFWLSCAGTWLCISRMRGFSCPVLGFLPRHRNPSWTMVHSLVRMSCESTTTDSCYISYIYIYIFKFKTSKPLKIWFRHVSNVSWKVWQKDWKY